jgi:adenine-specific DNA-methyltransferase
VLWLKGYGNKLKTIKIASSQTIDSQINFHDLSPNNWNSNKVFYSESQTLDKTLHRYKVDYGFQSFSKFADVKIGVVTGAVDYFIISNQEAKQKYFEKNRLVPILESARQFPEYLTKGKECLKVLIKLKPKDHLKYRNFIKYGIESNVHLRSHSMLRQPWYKVKVGETPDAFFHYRTTRIPYLIFNPYMIQCTNAIHRVYFKNVSTIERKWIFVSMLSGPSQLSLEANSKVYGRGVMKIEPSALKNALVLIKSDSSILPIYNRIIKLLSKSRKDDAMKLASEFIYNSLSVSAELRRVTERSIASVQNLR